MIKNIFGRIWATWGAIVFISTLLIAIIPIWLTNYIKEPGGTEIFRRISKLWMQVFIFLIGCRLIIKGKENFIKGQNYIVVSNHNSYMDVPLTTPFIPGPNKTIAKAELAKVPLFGTIYKRGSILVDRKSERSRKESFGKMKAVLGAGMHMCIYPEGTRNRTNEPLKSFHDGAFKLAIDTGKPIIPVLLFNTKKVLPGSSKPFYLWPAKMEMHFLPAVHVQPGDSVISLRENIFQIMYSFSEAKIGKTIINSK
ncbi:1-acyl-sn-glycerol-3-phosphate acyltransferase [Terrimonas sp.]|uniref:lysophospholipid acyltransferase family protein n=1 Tax=Terrimonas sp. TaxID=1914338 RepID=UPI000D5225AD|nr:lysophospholipid acyltransferase family protein [Terrimonas sp.]PVD53461.1 1-acyl-sn-glycerol-3-phosphate acyltransferase [Terrimonas sp.]